VSLRHWGSPELLGPTPAQEKVATRQRVRIADPQRKRVHFLACLALPVRLLHLVFIVLKVPGID